MIEEFNLQMKEFDVEFSRNVKKIVLGFVLLAIVIGSFVVLNTWIIKCGCGG